MNDSGKTGRVRHSYAGDVGDYLTYALLRAMSDAAPLRLGVVWYLTDHPEQRGDGRFRHHLTRDGWEALDPHLLTELRRLDRAGALSIEGIQESAVFPAGTVFYGEPMPEGATAPRLRMERRAEWFTRALSTVASCDVVFLDPDNGLEVTSVRPGSRLAGKYATTGEVAAFLQTSLGVVLYQHRDRRPWPQQRANIMAKLVTVCPGTFSARVLRFGNRLFICLSPRDEFAVAVDRAIDGLCARTASWGKTRRLQSEMVEIGPAGAEYPLCQRHVRDGPMQMSLGGGQTP